MRKFRFAILKNELKNDHLLWVKACEEREEVIEWEVIDLTCHDWLERIAEGSFDGLLVTPAVSNSSFKAMCDERLYVLNEVMKIPVYPSLEEIRIYENKRFLAYWLAANDVPHPSTKVFYHRQEAFNFLKNAAFPLVGKTNLGASGRGVRILKTKGEAAQYVNDTFSGKGAPRSTGPNWKKKGLLKRAIKKLLHPGELANKLQEYGYQSAETQKDFVILQEYIPHAFEWRCVRIGDSFFAHKKMTVGEMASGSLVKGYENPPLNMLDFVKEVTGLRNFLSQSVDIFATEDGQYLVNEMQCIFGQSDPYQMLVDGVPGRYCLINGKWQFEPGDFNRHESHLLRLDHFLRILTEQTLVLAS